MPESDRVKLPKRGGLLARAFDKVEKRRGAPGAGVRSDELMIQVVAEATVMATKEFRRAARALDEIRELLAVLAGPVPVRLRFPESVGVRPPRSIYRLPLRRAFRALSRARAFPSIHRPWTGSLPPLQMNSYTSIHTSASAGAR